MMNLRFAEFLIVAAVLALAPSSAHAIDVQEINQASFQAVRASAVDGPDPFVVKAQTLLGRRSISPGVIDGYDGENYRKAVAQFRRQENLGGRDEVDEDFWRALSAKASGDIVVKYTITRKDADYDFAGDIPSDYAKQAKMKRLGYTSPSEMFAERFHMDVDLLKALNPNASFKAGEAILVVDPARGKTRRQARLIQADKTTGMVVAYGADDRIIASYPATIGSENTPSPEGEHEVVGVAMNPTYHYNPEKNFQQGDNVKKLVLPPGPNNPVGTVWIDLSKPTYGIHGTSAPSKISKSSSHGCVRLTNWDAEELARMTKPGVIVRFTN